MGEGRRELATTTEELETSAEDERTRLESCLFLFA